MKTCSQCSKTFPDSEYFCHYDGTALHELALPASYKHSARGASRTEISPDGITPVDRTPGIETNVIGTPVTTATYSPPDTQREEAISTPATYVPPSESNKSPSRYVTRPSIERPQLMAGNGGPSNGTDLAPTRPQSLSRVPSKRKDTSKAFLIVIAMLVVGFLVVAAVAYLVYPRFTERSGPTFVVSPVGDAKPSNAAEVHSGVNGIKEIDPDKYQLARDAYESGVKHQEQAARLADAGQRAEANSESERAIAKYREAIQFFPRMAEAHENLGVAFYNTGRSDGAVSEYEIALQLVSSPTSQLLTNYGYALLGLKRFRDAADAFGRALKIEPSDYDLHFYRGSALYFAGDTLSAFAAYSEYLHLAPRGQYAEQARDFLAGRSVPADGAN